MSRHLLQVTVLATLILVAVNPLRSQPNELPPLPGRYILPNANLPFIPGSSIFRTGAMGSGMFYSGGNEFWGITDRGPNVDSGSTTKIFGVPDFQTRIFRMRLDPKGTISLVDSLYLQRTGGGPTSGLPNPAPYNTGETARDMSFNDLGTDIWGFDCEGILRAPDRTFWICEEYGPSISHVAGNGEVIERIWPQPNDGLPDILKRRRPNRGFEGIAMAPNGKLYAIVQSGMTNSFAGTAKADDDASGQTELIRIVEFDPATRQSRMFAYLMDAGYPVKGSEIRRKDIKMGDMVALNDDEFLVLEHAERGSQNVKRVYKFSLAGATPITLEAYQVGSKTKSLEELTREEISSIAGIVPVTKSLVLDLLNPGAGNPSWPAGQDKPEGLTILDPMTIAISTDSDFGVDSPDADGVITFTGKQTEMLVYALNTPLNYLLGPQGTVATDGTPVTPASEFFQKDLLCNGEAESIVPLTITNTSKFDLRVDGFDVYRTDTIYGEGVPKYPLLRNANGTVIVSPDYTIQDFTPIGKGGTPVIIAPGASQTFHVAFRSILPGKRFARAFVRTNGTNFSSTDTLTYHPVYGDETPRYGLMTFDLFGRGTGGYLSDNGVSTHRPKPIVFKSTKVGDTVRRTIQIYNPGTCDLRIGRKELRIVSGDAREFVVENVFSTAVVDQSSDTYIIPPGDSAAITFAFLPSRTGSRRATVRLQTNDSTIIINGLTERGSYYWDLFGTGSIGLEASRLSFRPAVIGDPEGASTASTTIENTARELIRIDSMKIVGPNAAEFAMDPAKPWPATPFAFVPGTNLNFSVSYVPQPGTAPGIRQAQLLLFTSGGDTIVVELRAEAATRSLAVSPSSLFDGVTIAVGKSARQTVMITNTGTTVVRLGTTTISGATAGDYILSQLPRLVLSPGQTEYLEVTYRPVGVGASSGVLTVNSNATNGAQTVMLGGSGKRLDGAATPGTTSGIESSSATTGMALESAFPNPAANSITFTYSVAERHPIELVLYDGLGTRIRTIDIGVREPGTYSIACDLRDIPEGVYYYRLATTNGVLIRSMTIIR